MALSRTSLFLLCLIALALLHTSYAAADSNEVIHEYIIPHLNAREQVGIDRDLIWDDELFFRAESYTQESYAECKLELGEEPPYGVNTATSSGDLVGETAVEMWVAEKANYNYTSNTCAPGKVCSHYTQVVWRDSDHIGCAKSRCLNGGTLVVCLYKPKGNIKCPRPY